jgi:hypothetical protein
MVKPVESAVWAVLKGLNLQLSPLRAEACSVLFTLSYFLLPSLILLMMGIYKNFKNEFSQRAAKIDIFGVKNCIFILLAFCVNQVGSMEISQGYNGRTLCQGITFLPLPLSGYSCKSFNDRNMHWS